eukprot:scaffold30874_cov21-Tisochrysis_lutea.AAC.4
MSQTCGCCLAACEPWRPCAALHCASVRGVLSVVSYRWPDDDFHTCPVTQALSSSLWALASLRRYPSIKLSVPQPSRSCQIACGHWRPCATTPQSSCVCELCRRCQIVCGRWRPCAAGRARAGCAHL